MKDFVNKLLDNVIKYSLIPIIIYAVGFVFVQGLISPLSNGIPASFFNILIPSIPGSRELYLINGIIFVLKMIIPLGVVISLLFGFKQLLKKNETMKKRVEGAIRSHPLLNIIVILAIWFIVIIVNFTFIKNLYIIDTFFNLQFVFFITTILYYFYYLKKKNIKLSEIDYSWKFLFFIITFFGLIFWIYINGIINQLEIVNSAETNPSAFMQGAKILDYDNKVSYSLLLDISNNFFIGWDLQNKTIKVIPTNRIKSIEDYKIQIPKKYVKYLDNNNSSLANQIVKDYYQDRIEDINAEKFFSLLSNGYYENAFKMESSSIAQKEWINTQEYDGKNLKDFWGFDMSNSVTEKNLINIYVIEYWKTGREYVKFSLSNIDNKLLITDVEYLEPGAFLFKD